jgi:hypothetical protein
VKPVTTTSTTPVTTPVALEPAKSPVKTIPATRVDNTPVLVVTIKNTTAAAAKPDVVAEPPVVPTVAKEPVDVIDLSADDDAVPMKPQPEPQPQQPPQSPSPEPQVGQKRSHEDLIRSEPLPEPWIPLPDEHPEERSVIRELIHKAVQIYPGVARQFSPERIKAIAYRMNEIVYASSRSREEYLDQSTLKERVNAIARDYRRTIFQPSPASSPDRNKVAPATTTTTTTTNTTTTSSTTTTTEAATATAPAPAAVPVLVLETPVQKIRKIMTPVVPVKTALTGDELFRLLSEMEDFVTPPETTTADTDTDKVLGHRSWDTLDLPQQTAVYMIYLRHCKDDRCLAESINCHLVSKENMLKCRMIQFYAGTPTCPEYETYKSFTLMGHLLVNGHACGEPRVKTIMEIYTREMNSLPMALR